MEKHSNIIRKAFLNFDLDRVVVVMEGSNSSIVDDRGIFSISMQIVEADPQEFSRCNCCDIVEKEERIS